MYVMQMSSLDNIEALIVSKQSQCCFVLWYLFQLCHTYLFDYVYKIEIRCVRLRSV